jgi:hypothetical protein
MDWRNSFEKNLMSYLWIGGIHLNSILSLFRKYNLKNSKFPLL